MGIEIERKFLVSNDSWRAGISRSDSMSQGYLVGVQALRMGAARSSVRVRIAGDRAWLNIKAAVAGVERAEYEYDIPLADAQAMLATLCDGVMEKIRHHVTVDGALFEVDEFLGHNSGLIVAEIELISANSPYPKPAWLGREVSDLQRYYNVNLIAHPFSLWSMDERAAEDATC